MIDSVCVKIDNWVMGCEEGSWIPQGAGNSGGVVKAFF